MRDYKETLEWYREHQTADEIGFDPDGMCLKVVRVARDINAMHPTAKAAQDATPSKYRTRKIANLRKGMVLYYDDPNDSNAAGHVVTMIGRVKGFDPDSLHDILVETNSVVANEVVVVRGDYFKKHWGDRFQFGATYLNGQELDVFTKKAQPGEYRRELFRETGPEWEVKILDKLGERLPEVRERVEMIDKHVADLPDDLQDDRVDKFKARYDKDRVLEMRFLNSLLRDKPQAVRVRAGRDRINAVIKSLLNH